MRKISPDTLFLSGIVLIALSILLFQLFPFNPSFVQDATLH